LPDAGNIVPSDAADPDRLCTYQLGVESRVMLGALGPDPAVIHDDLLGSVSNFDQQFRRIK
jgi:hypothetical protein